ncbi:MAG TPA: glutamine synthetase family protein [Acidimicrobiales bacterium]
MPAPLSVEQLRTMVDRGDVDTVLVAFTDMQGRLQGKRCHARHFLDEVLAHGAEACAYLLAVDVDMDTVGGYAMASWDTGYGDFVMRPDLATLRPVPWQPGTALVLCDLEWEDGSPVAASPRQVLRRQLDRLAERGLVALAGTELEFIVFREPYEAAHGAGYRHLTPANQYNVDYSLVGTARVEPLLRRIRNEMAGAGFAVESAKGECNLGQHEIAFRYADALATADQHAVYKTAAKEIAAQEGMSLTFMAKYDAREGNSCHIHLSVRSTDDEPVMAGGDARGALSPLMERWIAGQLACLEELTLLFAPNVNSYKRFVDGSFAPTAVAWGRDNRTCALRVVGDGRSLRVENRVPGGDVNPYLALAATVAAGLHGLEHELPLPAPETGNAYASGAPRVPATLRDAVERFAASEPARRAFGADVVEHYAHAGRVELAAFDAAVTDWERVRGFERL